jgi:thiamine biosynthesis lipoprotein
LTDNMRQASFIMGMPIVIDIPDAEDKYAFDRAFDEFTRIDEKFSTYKPDSEISKFTQGQLSQDELSAETKSIFTKIEQAEMLTDGYFSARYKSSFDPSGYVKVWAIDRAAEVLEKNKVSTFCISAGGDILAKGTSGKKWNLAVQNPFIKSQVIMKISALNIALTTSGIAERGHHIINPKTGRPPKKWVSISVVGPNVIEADIYATAAFVMGARGLGFLEKIKGFEAMAVDYKGRIHMTSGLKNISSYLAVTGEVV